MHVQEKNGIGAWDSLESFYCATKAEFQPHPEEPRGKGSVTSIRLTIRRFPRYLGTMRTLLLALSGALALATVGCVRRVPAKPPPAAPAPAKVPVLSVRSLGTPSALIDPPPEPATDKMPFDLPLNQGYEIRGEWNGPNQVKGTPAFGRSADFRVKKGDNADVDPREVAETLEKWISSSGVQSTQSSGAGSLQRSIDYGTARTLGTITYSVRPEAPAKEVTFHLEVREQPRQPR